MKCHDLSYFGVICGPGSGSDQDGPRNIELTEMYHYWALFAVTWHYLGYFAVIRIQIRIFDQDVDFDQDGPRYTEITVMYHYWLYLP